MRVKDLSRDLVAPGSLDTLRGREGWIDVARGMVLVMLFAQHAANIPALYVGVAGPPVVIFVNSALLPYRMPMLMVISGMVLAIALRKPVGTYVSNKLRSIAWPYLIWAVVLLVGTDLLIGSQLARSLESWIPAGYLWFLLYLFIYAMVAPIVVRAWPGVPIVVAMVGALVLPETSMWQDLFYYAAFFFAGHAYATHRAVIDESLRPVVVRLLLIAVTVLFGLVHLSDELSLFGLPWPGKVPWLIPLNVIGVAVFLIAAKQVHRSALGRPLAAIGRESVVYYTTHWMTMAVLAVTVASLGVVRPTLLFAVLMAGAIVVGSLITVSRRWRVVDALFVAPRRSVRVRAGQRQA